MRTRMGTNNENENVLLKSYEEMLCLFLLQRNQIFLTNATIRAEDDDNDFDDDDDYDDDGDNDDNNDDDNNNNNNNLELIRRKYL